MFIINQWHGVCFHFFEGIFNCRFGWTLWMTRVIIDSELRRSWLLFSSGSRTPTQCRFVEFEFLDYTDSFVIIVTSFFWHLTRNKINFYKYKYTKSLVEIATSHQWLWTDSCSIFPISVLVDPSNRVHCSHRYAELRLVQDQTLRKPRKSDDGGQFLYELDGWW